MRFSLRTTVQVVFMFVLMLILHGYITVITTNSDSIYAPQVPVSQNGPQKRGLRDQESGPQSPPVFKSSQVSTNISNIGGIVSSQNLVPTYKNIKQVEIQKDSNNIENNNDIMKYEKVVISSKNSKDQESNILPLSRPTELSDVFISVKTTKRFHKDRLGLLLDTWVSLAQDETYFFSDQEDEEFHQKTNGHFINTNCSAVHTREALCCKMSVEYDYYIASKKRWFCHVDDDTYINIPELVRLLRKYNHTEDWYLGKPSLTHPLEIMDPDNSNQKFAFWFATGGAGFCLSRALALKMMPYTADGKLRTVCSQIRLPDDCTIGFIIYYHLHKQMTAVQEFHSHLEGLWMIKANQLDKQITLSYNRGKTDNLKNVVLVSGYSEKDDPSRFRSIHCRLFPYQKGCPQATT